MIYRSMMFISSYELLLRLAIRPGNLFLMFAERPYFKYLISLTVRL